MNEYIDNTIVEIYTDDTYLPPQKVIHFLGYGYFSDGGTNKDKPYRFLEYTWFIAPLKDVLEMGITEYEGENQDRFKQYITDCTKEECRNFYEHYNSGKKPTIIPLESVDNNIPDGCYILV